MNWPLFILLTYVLTLAEVVLRLLCGFGEDRVFAELLWVLAVYVALLAPSTTAQWAALLLGLLIDLRGGPVSETAILGPHALAFLLGAAVLLRVRSMVFRESVFTLTAMVFGVGLVVQVSAVLILAVRGWIDPMEGFSVADQLSRRFLDLLYTTAAAIVLGPLLYRTAGQLGLGARSRNPRAY